MILLIKNILDAVTEIKSHLKGDLLEISIKKSDISFCFNNQVSFDDISFLDQLSLSVGVTNITSFEDMLFVNFENLSEDMGNFGEGGFLFLYNVIYKLSDVLCSCPALQFVVSDLYIKVFIDLPNITVQNLVEVDKLFGSQGVLELNSARPYVLYVKDW